MSLLEYVKVGGIKTARLSRQGLVRAIATEIETHESHTPPKLLFDVNGHGQRRTKSPSPLGAAIYG